MTVTAAVVSWNTRELLLRCLASLEAQHAPELEVWVVDNSSSDGSAAAARARAPWAHVLEPGRNLGFGAAVNLIASRSRGEWLLIANADVELEAGALAAMLAAGADPAVGCVAPRLLLSDGTTQHSVHPLPTLPLVTAFNLGLHRLSRRLAERLCLEGRWDPERPRRVPWAIGACLLVRRAAFDAVGGFDQRQWLYAEDLDLGWRLADAGWVTRYQPAARVRHASGAAAVQVFGEQRQARFLAASYAMLARRRGLGRMGATAAVNIAGAGVRVAWLLPLALVSRRRRRALRENRRWLAAHLRGLAGCSTLLRPR